MDNTLRTVRLYGRLGTTFGRVHRLAVSSPAEAVQALCAIKPGFEKFLMTAKDRGMAFTVFLGKENITEEQLEGPAGQNDIRIAPVLLGAKSGGIFNIILGAVMVIAGVAVNYFSAGTASAFGNALIAGGVSMMLGGVVQLLAPTPKGIGAQDRPEDRPSYTFNGPVNTQAQGNPVPYVAGGPLIVGSAVISAGIVAEDVYVPTDTAAGGGGGGSGGGGGGGSPPWHMDWVQVQ